MQYPGPRACILGHASLHFAEMYCVVPVRAHSCIAHAFRGSSSGSIEDCCGSVSELCLSFIPVLVYHLVYLALSCKV